MILTDRAKEYFLNNLPTEYKYENSERGECLWLGNEINLLDSQYESLFHALIIEWFDRVGFYIQIQIIKTPISHNIYFEYLIKNDKPLMSDYYKTRKEATKQAIIKANEIYNNQNK